jgi:hypothetical protein
MCIFVKASLNTVSLAECECGERLQTEEYIFWDCKIDEDHSKTNVFKKGEKKATLQY